MTHSTAPRTYQSWPSVHPTALEVSDRASLARHAVTALVVTVALSLPPVTRATGISAVTVVAIIAVHVAWTLVVTVLLPPGVVRSPARFHVALAGSVVLNTMIVIAFPVLGGDPRTPLWMLPVMYACFNGAIQELEPSLGILAIHVGMPLLVIPYLLARGEHEGWSIAAPLLCSVLSAVGYNHLAQVSARLREARLKREESLTALRARVEDDDRARLARELHDSMGSSLAIVGLYGDLIERHVDRPDELRAIAGMVREAAHAGTLELAALLGAVSPASPDLDSVAATLDEHARRAAMSSGAAIDVCVLRGGDAELSGAARLVLVRVFQEALHNALEHGSVKHVDVRLAADDTAASIEVSDDGIGFSPQDAPTGRGLAGMRARASELGGTFTVSASPGTGAHICVTVPRSRSAP